MKLDKTLYAIFLAIGLAIGLSSCKKDDKSSNTPTGTAQLTLIVVNDVDGDLTTLDDQTPATDAVIFSIYTDGGNGFNLLQDIKDKKDKEVDKEGKYTITKLLPGNYYVEIDSDDDGNDDTYKTFQVFSGDNEVKVLVAI